MTYVFKTFPLTVGELMRFYRYQEDSKDVEALVDVVEGRLDPPMSREDVEAIDALAFVAIVTALFQSEAFNGVDVQLGPIIENDDECTCPPDTHDEDTGPDSDFNPFNHFFGGR